MKIVSDGKMLRSAPDWKELDVFNRLPEIRSIGKMIFDPVWARKAHKSSVNEFLHVIRGNVTLHIGRSLVRAAPGDTLLVPSGSMHRDDFDLSVGLEVFLVFFVWPPSREYFRIVPFKNVPELCRPIAGEIGRLCDRMQAGLDAGTEPERLLIASYAHNALLLVLREALREDERRRGNNEDRLRHGRALLCRAREFIDLHYQEQLSLDQIAASLRISPFYLSHLFSRESGFSFVEYITQVRMRKARELLAGGAKNVSEAAYAVGYHDASYFAKVFHRYYGISPHSVFGNAPPPAGAAKNYRK